ncbi:hypothetical protein EON63_10055 [archaeon]|nr:MAG: hypothetical protein EON63_10055 [archaeon]
MYHFNIAFLISLAFCTLYVAEEHKPARNHASALLALTISDVIPYRGQYQKYLKKHSKPLDRLLDHTKLTRFVKSLLAIEHHNAQKKRFKLELNEFADLTEEEILKRFGSFDASYPQSRYNRQESNIDQKWEFSSYPYKSHANPSHTPPTLLTFSTPTHAPPSPSYSSEHINWSTEENPIHFPILTSIHSQGTCGACWAFVTASIVEAAVKMTAVSYVKHVVTEAGNCFVLACVYSIFYV